MWTNVTRNVFTRAISSTIKLVSARSQYTGSDSAGYDGDGKTTVKMLNQDSDSPMNLVNSYSKYGFRLSNNLFIKGSILLFPTHVYSWCVYKSTDITPESLFLFDIIVPKVKIVIIGYGTEGQTYDSSLPLRLKERGISCELLPTKHAVTTYNFLACDAVPVAGAFCVTGEEEMMTLHDVEGLYQEDTLSRGSPWYFPEQDPRDSLDYKQKLKEMQTKGMDDDKKQFDP